MAGGKIEIPGAFGSNLGEEQEGGQSRSHVRSNRRAGLELDAFDDEWSTAVESVNSAKNLNPRGLAEGTGRLNFKDYLLVLVAFFGFGYAENALYRSMLEGAPPRTRAITAVQTSLVSDWAMHYRQGLECFEIGAFKLAEQHLLMMVAMPVQTNARHEFLRAREMLAKICEKDGERSQARSNYQIALKLCRDIQASTPSLAADIHEHMENDYVALAALVAGNPDMRDSFKSYVDEASRVSNKPRQAILKLVAEAAKKLPPGKP